MLTSILASLIFSATCLESSPQIWTWKCKGHNDELGPKCTRQLLTAQSSFQSLPLCRLTCGEAATLFPRPDRVTLGKDVIRFLPSSITHSSESCRDNVCVLLDEATAFMIQTLNKYHPKFGETPEALWKGRTVPSIAEHKLKIVFIVSGTDEYVIVGTDESYSLKVSTEGGETSVLIVAPTFFGARHALETLTQLVDYDQDNNTLLMLASASIQDTPVFPHRGLLVDTARNFLSVKTLKQILDGMSYNKLNTFHWHLTDSSSFPLKLESLPKMDLYGRYSAEEVYTAEDVKELVWYARVRGIKIIPELDAPAHVGHGWQWGETEGLGKLVICLDKQPWSSYCAGPPCGQMNLANQNLYKILEKVYLELTEMFSPIEMFHYGGDEVNLNCWNSSVEITEWMTVSGYGLDEDSYFKQWSVFQEKSRQLLTKANHAKEVPGILWTSTLTEGRATQYISRDKYIIHIWTKGDDTQIKDLLEAGYRVIMSNYDRLYLDCGVESWVSKESNWCSPYKGWQDIYDNDIRFLAQNLTNSTKYNSKILGGEAAAWSEQIDENTVDAKLWPRGSALAERLWSNPSKNYSFAEYRMLHHRQRLVQRGLKASRLQPEWCRQNGGQCRHPWKPPTEEEEAEMVAQGVEEARSGRQAQSQISSADSLLGIMEFHLFYIILFNIGGTFLY